MPVCSTFAVRFSLFAGLAALLCSSEAVANNQTATVSPVRIGEAPYGVELVQLDFAPTPIPTLHSFVAGEHDGQWVVIGGLTNGMHGFDLDQDLIPERKQNDRVWVIDPESRTSWSRSLDPAETADSGLTPLQLLSVTTANAEFEQVGDRLYMVGGYGDSDPTDPFFSQHVRHADRVRPPRAGRLGERRQWAGDRPHPPGRRPALPGNRRGHAGDGR